MHPPYVPVVVFPIQSQHKPASRSLPQSIDTPQSKAKQNFSLPPSCLSLSEIPRVFACPSPVYNPPQKYPASTNKYINTYTMSDAEAMKIFLRSPVTQDMIHHLVTITLQILPCESAKTITESLPSPPNSPPILKTKPLPSLMTFITKLVRYTNVYTGTLMATIVYMNRLKKKLPKDAKGLPCTRHRIFLACLIISSKNFNDSSPKNKHWAKYTDGLFRREDVNLMERQLLMLLDWNVQIDNSQLVHAWKRFLDPIKADLKKESRIRNNISKGMLVGSTQTIVVPKEIVNSSASSPTLDSSSKTTLKVSDSMSSIHSRASSVSTTSSSIYSTHSRSSSVSSIASSTYQTNNNNILKNASQIPGGFDNNMNNNMYNNNNKTTNQQLSQALKSLSANTPLSNYLKSVAMKEEQELNDLIKEYCGY